MNEEAFNISIRKFLKMVGINSQREIEHAVIAALNAQQIQGTETLAARMTLELPGVRLKVVYEGKIELEGDGRD